MELMAEPSEEIDSSEYDVLLVELPTDDPTPDDPRLLAARRGEPLAGELWALNCSLACESIVPTDEIGVFNSLLASRRRR